MSRRVERLREDFEAWAKRDLGELKIRYLFPDGWHPRVRIGKKRVRVPVLVTLGVGVDGQRAVMEGAPIANVKNGKQSCDVYKLYTRGPGGVGKGVIAAGEGAADVVTLGLAEVIFSPREAGTRNAKHTVTFCYDKEGKLLSLTDAPPE